MSKTKQYIALIEEVIKAFEDNDMYDTAEIVRRKLREIENE